MRRLAAIPGITFALVLVWKVALLLFTAQPVPANDSFFYDGPVVNYLLHGKYCNPSLALVLPISGNEVFCAYPPLYQVALLGWMSLFGTSALSAMWLHLLLFAGYALVLLKILQRLKTPSVGVNLAGLFLFSITFHDRPDSLAHLFGVLVIYAVVRSWGGGIESRANRWAWGASALVVLTLCTSLQIGGFYLALAWLLMLAGARVANDKFPFVPMALSLVLPAGLVALVKFGYPHLWTGFAEHARLTPTLTGLRLPHLTDILKMIRTVPGVLMVAALLPWILRRHQRFDWSGSARLVVMTLAGTTMALAVVVASLFVFTPNMVQIANYVQPSVVGTFLALVIARQPGSKLPCKFTALLLALALLVSVRAIGMTTWGVACATDLGFSAARERVRQELQNLPAGSTVTVSSAYLYDAARRGDLRWIHSDWPAKPNYANPNWERDALLALKPAKLVITQFDYYRRYEAVLAALTNRTESVTFQVQNTAGVPAPDSFRALQKVVQHVSWAPVVVDFSWK